MRSGQHKGAHMLTSRERVMAAVDHREPDRVPIDLGGHRSSGIMAIAYAKLKETWALDRSRHGQCPARTQRRHA